MDVHTQKVKTMKKLYGIMPRANSDRWEIFPGGHDIGGIAHCRIKVSEVLDIQVLINNSKKLLTAKPAINVRDHENKGL